MPRGDSKSCEAQGNTDPLQQAKANSCCLQSRRLDNNIHTPALLPLLQLWNSYLKERLEAVRGLSIAHPAVAALNHTFDRALVSMHKMPRIWLDYLEFLAGQHRLTHTRRVFDRALMALPITQHDRVWPLYLVRLSCWITGRAGNCVGDTAGSALAGHLRSCCSLACTHAIMAARFGDACGALSCPFGPSC